VANSEDMEKSIIEQKKRMKNRKSGSDIAARHDLELVMQKESQVYCSCVI
jgi:hypothetical protein